jgi:hypothetical protein
VIRPSHFGSRAHASIPSGSTAPHHVQTAATADVQGNPGSRKPRPPTARTPDPHIGAAAVLVAVSRWGAWTIVLTEI